MRADRLTTGAAALVCAALALAAPEASALRVTGAVALALVLPGYAAARAIRARDPLLPALVAPVVALVLGGVVLNVLSIPLSAATWAAVLVIIVVALDPRGGPVRLPRLAPRDGALLAAGLAVAAAALVLAATPLRPPAGAEGFTSLSALQAAGGVRIGARSSELHGERFRLVLAGRSWDFALAPGQRWSTVVPRPGRRVEARLFRAGDGLPYRSVTVGP